MSVREEVIYKVKPIEKIANMIVRKNVGPYYYIKSCKYQDEKVKRSDIIYYFFDDNGIYQKNINDEQGLRRPKCNEYLDLHEVWRVPSIDILEPPYNSAQWLCQMVLTSYMKPGMTIEDFERLLNEHKYDVYKYSNGGAPANDIIYYDGIDRDITKVEKPIYRNSNGNTKKSFDYILVDMNIRVGIKDKRDFIICNKKALIRKAVERIENDRSFKKYNVPIGVLKLSKIYRIEEATVEFIFELKDELREMEVQNE